MGLEKSIDMIKKIVKSSLVLVLVLSSVLFTPIFADYTDNATSNLDGDTFTVTTNIAASKLSSTVTSHFTGSAQMWAENTSVYATSSEKYSREVGYAPGGVTAYAGVTSGYAIKKCTGRGNATLTNGKSSTISVTVTA